MGVLSNSGTERLGDALKAALAPDARLSIISAYFSIFAFGELRDELERAGEVRFVFSEPTFLDDMDEEKPPREFEIARRTREAGVAGTGLELTLRNNLKQRALAHACAEWIRQHGAFRSACRSRTIQPGGTYVVERPDGGTDAFVGATADFTQEGLGYERRLGVVTMVTHCEGAAESAGLRQMFDQVWGDPAMVQDVTARVAEQVETLYRENAPRWLYELTLHHLFRDRLEDQDVAAAPASPAAHLQSSVVWNMLYDFQRDAVVGAIRKLERYRGCIIADSVGLGKTFEALAVIKYYEERNCRVLVLAPKKLRNNWTLYTANDERNPLIDDRFAYTVLNHTDLSRERGYSGDVNLETLRWENYDLVVIDESHNFRNKPTDRTQRSRYTRLMDEVVRAGRRTRVLMLTATPVNNRILDLKNQIEFITEGRDDYLYETDGIASISQVTRAAQRSFREWSELPDARRTSQRFVEMAPAEYFQLLDIFTIARSRKHVARYYGGQDRFPERLAPISFDPPIDAAGELPRIGELNDLIASLPFAGYHLLSYVRPDARPKYAERYAENWGNSFEAAEHRSDAVAVLMRVNLLKRMESSIAAFRITLERLLGTVEGQLRQLDAAEAGRAARAGYEAGYEAGDLTDDLDDADAAEFEAGGRVRVDLRDVDPLLLRPDLEYDRDTLQLLLSYARDITPERDAKLQQLREFLRAKAACPYNPGNAKVLVFSAFADTAVYLFDELAEPLAQELGLECALLTGTASPRTHTLKLPRADFEQALARFSPASKGLPQEQAEAGQIDVLFATDCISEGQNLQDCDCVVNYDIHWNPVRIIQRFGRVDRLGSANACVQLVNFWPDCELDEYINLEGRVKGRMVLLDTSATGEENVLEGAGKDEMNDLPYRRQQLEALREQVLDPEDISGGVSITDLGLEDYRAELEHVLGLRARELEAASPGLHAVARIPEALAAELEPGAVFCLSARPGAANPQDGNPVWPRYLVYVSDAGEVLCRHTNPKPALDALRACCTATEPDRALCAAFNRRTGDGTRMAHYTDLLRAAVADITGAQEERGVESLFSLGEVGAAAAPSFDDFSLAAMVVLVR